MDLSKLSFHRNLSIFPILLLTVSSDTEEVEEVEEVEGQGKRLGRIVNPSTHFPLGELLMGQALSLGVLSSRVMIRLWFPYFCTEA
eukprot:symbB.v1.2.024092.t1/scaffold2255.1/size84268/5